MRILTSMVAYLRGQVEDAHAVLDGAGAANHMQVAPRIRDLLQTQALRCQQLQAERDHWMQLALLHLEDGDPS